MPGNRRFFRALALHLGGSFDDPCLPTYFRFALSCNERGRQAASLIEGLVPLQGRRVLDVGCAYGGFLVALAERGAIPTGFDIDPSLLKLALHNFDDFGRRFPVHLADVTRRGDVARFKRAFDVITCNDVIEHVSEPEVAIRHIAAMLRRGGVAYFEIPNRDYVSFVSADGHYELFGITQLDHADAAAYFAAHAPGVRYSVGHYLRLPQYRAMFDAAGLEMHMLAPLEERTPDVARWLVGDLRANLESKLATVPGIVRSKVAAAVDAYLARAQQAAAGDASAFVEQYGVAFWRIVVEKRPRFRLRTWKSALAARDRGATR